MPDLELQLSKMNERLTSILSLLQGHELNKGDKGLVGRQDDHEGRILKMEMKFHRITWVGIGMLFPASWGAIDIIKTIITHLQ